MTEKLSIFGFRLFVVAISKICEQYASVMYCSGTTCKCYLIKSARWLEGPMECKMNSYESAWVICQRGTDSPLQSSDYCCLWRSWTLGFYSILVVVLTHQNMYVDIVFSAGASLFGRDRSGRFVNNLECHVIILYNIIMLVPPCKNIMRSCSLKKKVFQQTRGLNPGAQ